MKRAKPITGASLYRIRFTIRLQAARKSDAAKADDAVVVVGVVAPASSGRFGTKRGGRCEVATWDTSRWLNRCDVEG